ncbi:hypothetical protein YB2330_006566 [Saitoella coloradoensis]
MGRKHVPTPHVPIFIYGQTPRNADTDEDGEDREEQTGWDEEQLQESLSTAILKAGKTENGAIDLGELGAAVEFFTSEILSSSTPALREEEDRDMDLKAVEQHPLYDLLRKGIGEVLGLEDHEALLLTSNFMDVYLTPPRPPPTDPQGKTRVPEGCELCARPMPLTIHHLLPRSQHSRLIRRSLFTRHECLTRLAYLCRPCHSAIHRIWTNEELAGRWNTVGKIEGDERVRRWVGWVVGQRVVGKGLRTGR